MLRFNVIQNNIYIGYIFSYNVEEAFGILYDIGIEFKATDAPEMDTSNMLSVILNCTFDNQYYKIVNNVIKNITDTNLNIDWTFLEEEDDDYMDEDPFWEDDDDNDFDYGLSNY
ncbi:MAG TPA: hypothetical protein PKD00_01540 [Burkholderiales bacterium]|nr:hypothetical protein [Burkholderiales bacterium]